MKYVFLIGPEKSGRPPLLNVLFIIDQVERRWDFLMEAIYENKKKVGLFLEDLEDKRVSWPCIKSRGKSDLFFILINWLHQKSIFFHLVR